NTSLQERELALRVGGEVLHVTWGDVGAEIDVLETMRVAREIGHQGGVIRRLEEAHAARRGEGDVPLVMRTRRIQATQLLRKLAPRGGRAPIAARLDLAQRQKIADVPGQRLDVEASVDAIEEAIATGSPLAELALEPVQARVTLDQLARVDVEKIVASWETK